MPQKETDMSPHRERRRQQAIARYLAGDPLEVICREMGCSKSWRYKWRDRYEAANATWAQEVSRRPGTSPTTLSVAREEEMVH